MEEPVSTTLLDVPRHRSDHVRVRLNDGGTAALRPLHAGETDPLQAVFDGMSTASRQSRYLAGVNRLSSTTRDMLADIDGHDRVAWLATISGVPAGIGRYTRVAPDTAEVALEVVDAHQGRGLGYVLLDTVTTVARSNDVARVRATVHPANPASLKLLSRLGMRLRFSDGLMVGEVLLQPLDPARVDRSAVVAMATLNAKRPLGSVGDA
jgi:RimJ/RimL family protein N-acetyltransferase